MATLGRATMSRGRLAGPRLAGSRWVGLWLDPAGFVVDSSRVASLIVAGQFLDLEHGHSGVVTPVCGYSSLGSKCGYFVLFREDVGIKD